jgi:DNA-directed RNA polymerase subunit RPC12/RpoP
VKFVCDACGKKYATSEDPSPGKVYKLKCKACGHLIVVKSQAGTSTAIPAITAAEQVAGGVSSGGQAPELEIEIEPEHHHPSPTPPAMPVPTAVDDDAIIEDPAPLPPEVASAIDGAAPLPTDPPPELSLEDDPSRPQVPPAPPPGKDELADFAAAAAEVMAAPTAGAGSRQGYVDLFGDGVTGERPVQDGALSAAARSSLPSGYTGSDPLKPTRAQPPAPPRAAPPRPESQKAAPKGKGPSPLVFVVLGAVLIGGITIAAISSTSKKAEPAPPSPPMAAPAPLPAPRAEPPPRAAEKKPEPKPEARPEPKAEPPRVEPPRTKPPERKPEPRPPERKAEPRPEPKPEVKPEPRPPPAPPAAPPAPVEARTETRDVQLADAETALTPEIVQKVINANKKAFASCIAAAGSDVRLDGRKVVLKLTVNANGAVTYPTLDDVTLNPTEMGQCLKSAARLMIFPKFKGDPFHVEVPLTLSN